MSDLEFQRELSPEQIREALSLLDSKTGAQNHNLRVEDQSPPEEVDLEVDQRVRLRPVRTGLPRQKTRNRVRSI